MMVITVLELQLYTLVIRDSNWWDCPRGSVCIMDGGQEEHQYANVSLHGDSITIIIKSEKTICSLY